MPKTPPATRRTVSRTSLPGVSQTPNGTWRVRVKDPLGRTHHVGSFPSEADANIAAIQERAAMAEPGWVPPKARRAEHKIKFATSLPAIEKADVGSVLLGDYLDNWIERRALRVKPVTVRNYRHLTSAYVRSPIKVGREKVVLAQLPITSITGAMLTKWVDAVALLIRARSEGDSGLVNSKHAFNLVRAVLNSAVREGLLEVNPASRAEVSNPKVTEREPATPAQVQALADALPPHLSLTVLLAAWACARRGEVLGLQRRDVTLRRDDAGEVVGGSIHIRRNVVPGSIGTPKTAAGTRRVPVPVSVARALELHLIAYAAPGEDGWLFPSEGAGPLDPNNYRARYWSPARAKVDLPDGFTFHDLRHTGLTEARRAGADLLELQRMAGHASLAMVARYQHVDIEDLDAVATRLEARIAKSAATTVAALR